MPHTNAKIPVKASTKMYMFGLIPSIKLSNICPEMYWGFQIIRGDMKPHLDNVTISKMNYVIDPGGSDVMTEWYDPDGITVIDSVVLESHRWHILKVDTLHGVKNLDPGAVRFGITGRIF
jgi:uncharacterized protein YbbK (DUF523 family)